MLDKDNVMSASVSEEVETFDQASNHELALIISEKFTKNWQKSLMLILSIAPWYQQIKILPL